MLMSAVHIPVEVYVEILSHVATSREDPSIPTLLSCLQANTVIRAAALTSKLWEAPYRIRYTHSDDERERKRREAFGGDWRLLYIERRRVDRLALGLLDKVREERSGRHDRARRFTQEFGYDVWDALQLESKIPIPHWFRDNGTDNEVDDGTEGKREKGVCTVREAPPRRFWAKTVMGIIARYHVVRMWAQLLTDASVVSFEQSLIGLSAFFDASPAEITAQLDEIYATCRGRLVSDNVVLDPKQQGYNYWELCEKIREVIHQLGFRLAQGPHFSTVMNVFPHAFLQARYHETIPMSLVFVYVAVARRLGINATAANFPAVVQVHIQSPDPSEPPRLLDMRDTAPPIQLTENAIAPDMQLDEHTRPASAPMMLSRSSNNIIAFMRYERTYGQSMSLPWSLESHEEAFYAASSWIVMDSHLTQFIPSPPDSKPLDIVAVVLDAICPALQEIPRTIVSTYCKRCLETDEKKATSVKYRSNHPAVTYFVGLVFKHRTGNHIACIYGWDPVCVQSAAWVEEMNVDALPHGRNQPFYHTFATDGRSRYVAQDNIVPVLPSGVILTWLRKTRSAFDRYFVDVDVDDATSLGRLVVSKELQAAYPEDEQYGANWIHGWLE